MQTELLVRGVLVKDRHILLAASRKKKHLFLPGGHIEFAEAAHHALIREMMEETACTVHVGRFLGAVEHTWKGRKRIHSEVNLIFTMSCTTIHLEHTPVSQERKIVFVWHPFNDLTSINFQPAILRTLLPEWIAAASIERWASSYKR
ncbi:NUDIX domain-containing protein [candidate division WOR-3 bacterium]|nr:NUDIX domain-containing protein [candidate division WOR-3 bacterium]